MTIWRKVCLILGFSICVCPKAKAAVNIPRPSDAQIKVESLRRLQELRNDNVKSLVEVDRALTQKFELKATAGLVEDIEKLRHKRHEYALRQEFLDRLIFTIDTRYVKGNFREFVEHALIDMAKIDASSEGAQLWVFMKYAAESIHRLPEQREDTVAFLEGYMKRSVSNPVLPEEYLSSRNYTNGSKSETGNPMDRSEVGLYVEKRLEKIKAEEDAAAAPKAAAVAPASEPAPVAAPPPAEKTN